MSTDPDERAKASAEAKRLRKNALRKASTADPPPAKPSGVKLTGNRAASRRAAKEAKKLKRVNEVASRALTIEGLKRELGIS